MTISRWIIIKMTNVVDKIRRENQNTRFMFNNFSSRKSYRLCDSVEKYGTATGVSARELRLQTHSEYVTVIVLHGYSGFTKALQCCLSC
jgi:hypothetical protein